MVRQRRNAPIPKAIACGMLEDRGRIFFLLRIDEHGGERLEIPCVFAYTSTDPISQLAETFKKQTGIDAEVCEIRFETRYNAGTRRNRKFIPCLVFRMRSKSAKATPAAEFSGFKWLSLDNAKKQKLGKITEWLRYI